MRSVLHALERTGWQWRREAGPATRVMRWSSGAGVAVMAVFLRVWWLEPFLGPGYSYIQSHPAILFAAWIGGTVGGLLATTISAILVAYAVLPPPNTFQVERAHVLSLVVFLGVGSLISILLGALQRAKKDATTSEERYRSLVELSPDAVFVHVGGTIVYANATTLSCLNGSNPADVLGRSLFDFVAPASQELARSRTRQLMSNARRVAPVEQEWVRLDGSSLPVEVAAARVPWGDGEGIQVIFREMSERRRVEQERESLLQQAQAAQARAEEAQARAEQANRLKEEFLAVLSHELRTPLNAVLGWTRMINTGVTSGERVTHALAVIERNAKAQMRLVEDLLDISRIVTGRFQFTMQPLDLRQAVANAVESVRPAAAAKDITLDLLLPPDAVSMLGDSERVQQVIWNLLSNAVKFTGAGGSVYAAVAQVGTEAEVIVSDTGAGISPDFLPHVFDRFRQQDGGSTRANPGLGLGLSLVRYLVEAHGGRVYASSPGVGTGSTFVVRFPAGDRNVRQEVARPAATKRPLHDSLRDRDPSG